MEENVFSCFTSSRYEGRVGDSETHFYLAPVYIDDDFLLLHVEEIKTCSGGRLKPALRKPIVARMY